MISNRRNFLLSTSLASGAVFFGGVQSALSSQHDGDIHKIVSKYGSTLSSRKTSKGELRMKVKVTNHANLAQQLSDSKLPWERIEVLEDNMIKLSGGKETVLLKHVS